MIIEVSNVKQLKEEIVFFEYCLFILMLKVQVTDL